MFSRFGCCNATIWFGCGRRELKAKERLWKSECLEWTQPVPRPSVGPSPFESFHRPDVSTRFMEWFDSEVTDPSKRLPHSHPPDSIAYMAHNTSPWMERSQLSLPSLTVGSVSSTIPRQKRRPTAKSACTLQHGAARVSGQHYSPMVLDCRLLMFFLCFLGPAAFQRSMCSSITGIWQKEGDDEISMADLGHKSAQASLRHKLPAVGSASNMLSALSTAVAGHQNLEDLQEQAEMRNEVQPRRGRRPRCVTR